MSDLREAFERSVTGAHHGKQNFKKDDAGYYLDHGIDNMWWAWKAARAQSPEMSRIAQRKIDQLGAKPAGLLVQNEAGRYAAVDVHGRVKWMNEDVCRCVGAGNGCCCDTCDPGEEQSSDDQSAELVFTDTAEEIDERLRYEAENDCPHCGGSGHKDDCTQGSEPPVALHQVQIRALRRNVERNCGPEMAALLEQLIACAHAQGSELVGYVWDAGRFGVKFTDDPVVAKRLKIDGVHVREVGYTQPQSAGEAGLSPEDRFDHYMRTAIAHSPAPIQELGDYLASVLNEDNWPQAERLLNQICTQPQSIGAPIRTIKFLRDYLNVINKTEDSDRDTELEFHLDAALNAISSRCAGVPEWVKCSDRLPKLGQRVQLFSRGVLQHMMPLFDDCDEGPFWDFEVHDFNPPVDINRDLWLPLPHPPAGQEG